MSSPKAAPSDAPRVPLPREGVWQVLDLGFGFFVWAVHFIVIYGAAAVACVVGFGRAEGGARSGFIAALVLLTALALVVLMVHALRRYRQEHSTPDLQFRMMAAIGCDAVAAVAVLWQLFPLLLIPLCA